MIENFVERIPESLKSKHGATFYSGCCVKPKPNSPLALDELSAALKSDDMDFFIKSVSRPYQGGWMSYAKSFIGRFPVVVGCGVGADAKMESAAMFGVHPGSGTTLLRPLHALYPYDSDTRLP